MSTKIKASIKASIKAATKCSQNPLGLNGIEFVEFASPKPDQLRKLFFDFGFSRISQHKEKNIEYFEQNDIRFLLNNHEKSFAQGFARSHGPSIVSMGWRVANAEQAMQYALSKGAEAATMVDYSRDGQTLKAIVGVGGSLIYFIDSYDDKNFYKDLDFELLQKPDLVDDKGFLAIDHLTNNVFNGTMEQWSNFYKDIFGFTEIRYFDIKGKQTGLQSYALKSPCGKFSIPINEAQEEKSQINEFLEEYNGPGVQHLALVTKDILQSLKKMKNTSVEMLDISDDYYKSVFQRVPGVSEDKKEIQKYNVLVDGDDKGYLLQIFTKNIVGPIFFEIIQRKNHWSFGEGNFQALFESIERDQEKRGYFTQSANERTAKKQTLQNV